MKWRIYYDDGSWFDNEHGSFKSAPVDGVQGIVVADDEVGRHLLKDKEYYFILPDGTIGATNDLGPFLRTLGIIKFGRWTGDKPYKGTLKRMMDDPDFPKKTAKYKSEQIEL